MTNPHLIEFIQSFNSTEIKVIEEYLEKMAEPEELELFRIIVSDEENISDESITKLIHTNTLQLLKGKLFDKILEALQSDNYILNKDLFDQININKFLLGKKVMMLEALHHTMNKGRRNTMQALIEDAIKFAKENEAYDIIAELLFRKKSLRVIIGMSMDEFDTLTKESAFYDYCHKAVLFANDCFHKLLMNNIVVKSLSKNEMEKSMQTSIKQLEHDYKITKSHYINYFLLYIKIALYEHKKNYFKSIAYCNKLILLVRNCHFIFDKQKHLAHILMNLSLFKTFIGDYKEAILDSQESQNGYASDSLGYILGKEQEFGACFYAGEYENAEKCINIILKHPVHSLGEFRYAKYIFFQACTLFALKKYKQALAILSKPLEIEKDKSRWNIGVRVLTIMLFVELNKIEEAAMAVESLRKYMERIIKKDEVEPRTILIVKLLRELEKNSFVYDPKNSAATKLLKTVAAKNKPTSWEHFTPELIKFHEWVGEV